MLFYIIIISGAGKEGQRESISEEISMHATDMSLSQGEDTTDRLEHSEEEMLKLAMALSQE